MGCAEQKETIDTNDNPPKETEKDKKKKGPTVRVLILGTAEVGKSTFFKQIRILHGEKFKDDEVALFRRIIYRNIHTGVMNLITQAEQRKIDLTKFDPEISAFRDSHATDTFDQAKYSAAKTLWAIPEMQKLAKEGPTLLTDPHLVFFLSKIDNLVDSGYILTHDDILRLRQRTIGMPTLEIPFKGRTIQMVDFGGQEVERKKWPLLAEGAKALIFLASLTHYDTPAEEDKSKTRLQVSLEVFGQVIQDESFASCSVVLFMNKWDLFQEQIKVSPLSKFLPKYTGPTDPTSCGEFLKSLYNQQIEGSQHKTLSAHFTTATDTTVIEKLFQSVLADVLRQSFEAVGFGM